MINTSSELRNRQHLDNSEHNHHDHQCNHDDDDHHHHHHSNDDEMRNNRPIRYTSSTDPSFLITWCTNLSYFIIATSILVGLFITNEQFSFIREESNRKLDFTKINFTNTKSSENNCYNLLFVHGAFGGKEEWMQNYFPYFQKVENPNIKSIGAFSMTGHGQSSHSEYIKWLRLHDFVQDLKLIIDQNYKSGEKIILVCHSLGGLVCQKYLEMVQSMDHHQQTTTESVVVPIIRSLILLGSIPPIHRFDTVLSPMLFDPSILLDMLLYQRLDPLVTKTIKHTKHFMYHEKTSESEIETISKQVPLNQEGIIYYFDCLTSSLNPTAIMEYCSRRRMNVMVVGVEKDSFFSVGQFEKTVEFWKLILNSKSSPSSLDNQVYPVLVPNTVQVGHQMMLDRDWEFVANQMNEFIKELVE